MTSQPHIAAFEARAPGEVRLLPGLRWAHLVKRFGVMLAGSMVVAALAGCAWYFLRPPALSAVTPRIGPAVTAVYASGTVEASVMLPVAPRVGGRLVALLSDENESVRKGQVLARLESEDLAGNIAQLKANAEFARTDKARDTNLVQQNAIARQTYDRAVADSNMAEAAVRQAEAQAGFMTLSAPDDCAIIQRDGEIGQFIAADTPLFWLSCRGALRISAQVDEEDIALVRVGQRVLIRADAFSGRIFEAKVSEITPKGDPIGRSYRVRINLPPGSPLEIGMTTEANIIISTHDKALLLPAGAVSDGQVWRLVDGRAVHTAVSLGAKDNNTVEITGGLSRGDLVLSDGSAVPPAGSLRVAPAP
jgi:RND family efflux transporter MFP subunit